MQKGLRIHVALALGVGGAAALTAASPVTALGLAGGMAAGAALLHRVRDLPRLALFAIVAMVPLDGLMKLGDSFTVVKLIFPAGFGLLLLDRALKPRPFVWSGQCMLVAAFGLSVALSLLVNPIDHFARHSAVRYAGVLLLFFFAVNVLENERHVRTLILTMIFSCVISATVGALGHVGGGWDGGEHAGRLMGLSTVNPNTFATYLLTAALPAAYFMLTDRRVWFKALMLATLFILGLGIVLSLSRAVSLVAAVSGFALLFQARREVSPWKAALLLALLLGCLLPLIPTAYYERFYSLMATPRLDRAFQSRQSFNHVAWQLFTGSPILGIGPGRFSERFTSDEFRYMANTLGYWKMVHNLYLAVACHMGLVGLLLFGAVVARAFADLRSVARTGPRGAADVLTREATALNVALIAFLLNAAFLPAEHEKYMWVLFAACAALAEMRRRTRPSGTPDACRILTGGTGASR